LGWVLASRTVLFCGLCGWGSWLELMRVLFVEGCYHVANEILVSAELFSCLAVLPSKIPPF
jgi:hypothetical protein